MTTNALQQHALNLLHAMLDTKADFRPGQWEAIETVAVQKKRALVVQRTGWRKSLVYFLATKLLREQGAEPTLLISPLLSLMRNQIEMAKRISIRAYTIHSANREEWDTVEAALKENACDILLISPERLNNERFIPSVQRAAREVARVDENQSGEFARRTQPAKSVLATTFFQDDKRTCNGASLNQWST